MSAECRDNLYASPPEAREKYLDSSAQCQGLVPRILGGEVIVLRGVLREAGVHDALANATIEAIASVTGAAIASRIREEGFEALHESIEAAQIPVVADAVYDRIMRDAPATLARLVSRVFADAGGYYFERRPNVRFHIPFDCVARQQPRFDAFARSMGDGKITAHGPHRDPWLDCPANAINIWVAVSRVERGNGLAIFEDAYRTPLAFERGYMSERVALPKPLTLELDRGDAVLFHGSHLHGSILNSTPRTRYVVSYRLTFGRPRFVNGARHRYVCGATGTSSSRRLANISEYLRFRFASVHWQRALEVARRKTPMSGRDAWTSPGRAARTLPAAGERYVEADMAVGSIRALSPSVCVARLGVSDFAAVSRRCPHKGGDLAGGWIEDGRIVCPLHSLSFDPRTGRSACQRLPALACHAVDVRNGRVELRSRDVERT